VVADFQMQVGRFVFDGPAKKIVNGYCHVG
jgi:hypothetical protein